MKKLITICLILFVTLSSTAQKKKSSLKKHYYTLHYFAKVDRYKYENIFEQKIIVSTESPDTFLPKLNKQYVEFITNNHPEYYTWHIYGKTNQVEIDSAIKANAQVSGGFISENEARKSMEILEAELQDKYDKNPEMSSVTKVNDFVYKGE